MAEADKLEGLAEHLRCEALDMKHERNRARNMAWADAVDALAASPQPAQGATEEDRAAILEATQAIRDHGRDLIENEWSSTGESLMAKAQKIERIVLKGTHEPR